MNDLSKKKFSLLKQNERNSLLDYIHNNIQQLNDQHVMNYLKDLIDSYLLYQTLMKNSVLFEYQFLIQSK